MAFSHKNHSGWTKNNYDKTTQKSITFLKQTEKRMNTEFCIQYSKYFRSSSSNILQSYIFGEKSFYYAVFMMLEMRCYAQASRSR